jgi:hypothetical protein
VLIRGSHRFVKHVIAAFTTMALSITPVKAQAKSNQSGIEALSNLFGAIAKAGAKSKAVKQWKSQDPQLIQCVNTIFSSKSITTDTIAASGLGPTDQRISPLIDLCKAALTAQPRTNFQCNVANERRQMVDTICDESYAVFRKGSWVAISREDFLRAVGDGEKVDVKPFETGIARTKRVRAERQATNEAVSPSVRAGNASRNVNANQDDGDVLNERYRQEWLKKVGTIFTKIHSPKMLSGSFRLIDKNASVEEFIGNPIYQKNGLFKISILSIPDNVRIFVPMYNFQKRQGYTIDASAVYANYIVNCNSKIFKASDVQYLIGKKGIYKNLITYYSDNKIYDYNSIFTNLQSNFFYKRDLDEVEFRSIEFKKLCK